MKNEDRTPGSAAQERACDNGPTICRADDIPEALARSTVPAAARRPVNRCNLPAEALASLAFQLDPVALELDGVLPLHRALFAHLDATDDVAERARMFRAHMTAHFLLDDPEAQGWTAPARVDRSRLDYLRVLRGWLFDAESREGAVLKGWVESRFGLLTQFHRAPLADADGPARAAFEHELASGLYATGALEAQLDLLYAFCQYELARRRPGARHITLYRGQSGALPECGPGRLPDGRALVRLDNLSSFSSERERADEFGDRVVACEVPHAKVLGFSRLLPGWLQGEDEFLVIGGVAAVRLLR